jgi:hypothetical protein
MKGTGKLVSFLWNSTVILVILLISAYACFRVIGTSFLEMVPQPTIETETAIFREFIAGQATNNKVVSNATIEKLIALYPPTKIMSNSSLYERAATFMTDIAFLAPQRIFIEAASTAKRNQDVWAYSFQQRLPGAPEFLGGKSTHPRFRCFFNCSVASLPYNRAILPRCRFRSGACGEPRIPDAGFLHIVRK